MEREYPMGSALLQGPLLYHAGLPIFCRPIPDREPIHTREIPCFAGNEATFTDDVGVCIVSECHRHQKTRFLVPMMHRK
jgi:hypothetical protein